MLKLDTYECIFEFETDEKTYKYGDLISKEEYEELTAAQTRFFIIPDEYKVKKRKVSVDDIDNDGEFVTGNSFELQFGFKDTLEVVEYKESDGLEVRSIPKGNNLIDY